jgi:hypothetical protein
LFTADVIAREAAMLKTFITLIRGATAAAEEELVDRTALLILEERITGSSPSSRTNWNC